MTAPDNRLVTEFGEPRETFALFTAEEADQLWALFSQAILAHHDGLDASMDKVLGVLPRLMRAPARKILLGR